MDLDAASTSRAPLTRREALVLATAAALSARSATWPASALADPGHAGPQSTVFVLSAADFPRHAGARSAGDRVTSRVLRARRHFDVVGLRHGRARAPDAELRARRLEGSWSAWTPVAAGSDHAPDARARRATEPVWVGGMDELQIRLPARAPLPDIHLVSRATASARARTRFAATGGAGGPVPAPGGGPPIVSREAWGGDSVTPRAAPSYGEVQLAFVHHTVTANDYGPEDSAAMVLAIAAYHRDANGWNDIGYNFLVDRFGQIFEGRAGGIERAVVGAQAQGYNATSTGVALLGTHGAEQASEAALAALGRLIGWKLARHGVPASGAVTVVSAGGPTNRYPTGRPVTFDRVAGHRDGDHTACPGAALYGQLVQVRRTAAEAAVGVPPAPPPAPVAISAAAASARVRSGGRGVLIRGSVQGDAPVRIVVARQVGGRWRWVRTVAARQAADGFSARVRLATPGLYRLTATAGGVRAEPAVVRSVGRRAPRRRTPT